MAELILQKMLLLWLLLVWRLLNEPFEAFNFDDDLHRCLLLRIADDEQTKPNADEPILQRLVLLL